MTRLGTGEIYRMSTSGREVDFPVIRTADVFEDAGCSAAVAERRSLLVTTSMVANLYGDRIERLARRSGAQTLVLDVDESRKSLESVQHICAAAADHQLGRRDQIVAIGGGVCLDLVTLAASLYRRGIPHLRIPTTLIGQVDAGIGAKGAVNYNGGKNSLGCFHPPSRVFVDRALLATLSKRDLKSGLAEIVKMAVIADPDLFAVLEKEGPELVESRFQHPGGVADWVLDRSIVLMSDELAADLFEKRSLERKVDAGHTFSPKIETRSGFAVTHGEAVAIDLAFSASLAHQIGLLDGNESRRVIALLAGLGLAVDSGHLDLALCQQAVAEAIRHRGGRLHLPLAEAIGTVKFVSDADAVGPDVLRRALSAHSEMVYRREAPISRQGS
jgi:3-dehydroquinate synthetase